MSRKLLPLTLTAALMGGAAFAEVPKVAVDIAPLHSLVSRVMDGVGAPDLIVQQGASPHGYSLRPSEAAALQNADLVFWIGPDLTPWLSDAIETLASDATVTELLEAEGTIELEFREGALFEAHADHDHHGEDGHNDHDDHKEEGHEGHDHDEHKEEGHEGHDHDDHKEEGHEGHDHDDHKEEGHEGHDHDDHKEEGHEGHDHDDHKDEDHDDHADAGHEGHNHGEHDPHAWLSPDNAKTWLNVIAAQLSAADTDNAGAYFANAAAGRAEMDSLMAEVNATLEPARGGQFIVFHDAYQHFEVAFDFPAAGAISLGDASDPSPARIAEIQARIAEQDISCVLSEPQFNPGLVATILDGTEANTGILDPLGSDIPLGSAFYPQLIGNMASTLAECL